MAAQPKVLGPTELENGSGIGETIQVSMVTDELDRALSELTGLGIGPWMIFDVNPSNSSMTYRGDDTGFSMRMAIANHGAMMWEVVEPTGGRSIYQDFVDGGHRGFHHVGVDGGGRPYPVQAEELKARGYEEVQGGTAFDGQVPFAYFHNGEAHSPWIEIFEFPEGFEPEPDEWYPAPPPAE